ncbi:unnamed protein product [Prunus armeniaca]
MTRRGGCLSKSASSSRGPRLVRMEQTSREEDETQTAASRTLSRSGLGPRTNVL